MGMLTTETALNFLNEQPYLFAEMKNQKGQQVRFYEHPWLGDTAPIYAEIDGAVYCTGFYDMDDFYEGSDYMPVRIGDNIKCQFEVES